MSPRQISTKDAQIMILNILSAGDLSAANPIVEKNLRALSDNLKILEGKEKTTKEEYFVAQASKELFTLIESHRTSAKPDKVKELVKNLCNVSDIIAYYYLIYIEALQNVKATIKEKNLAALLVVMSGIGIKICKQHQNYSDKIYELLLLKIDDRFDENNKSRCAQYLNLEENKNEKNLLVQVNDAVDTVLDGMDLSEFDTNRLQYSHLIRNVKNYKQLHQIYCLIPNRFSFNDLKVSLEKRKLPKSLTGLLNCISPENHHAFFSSCSSAINCSLDTLNELRGRNVDPFIFNNANEFLSFLEKFPIPERNEIAKLYKKVIISRFESEEDYKKLFKKIPKKLDYLNELAYSDNKGVFLKWLLSLANSDLPDCVIDAFNTAINNPNLKSVQTFELKAIRYQLGLGISSKQIANQYFINVMEVFSPYLSSLGKIEGDTIQAKQSYFEEYTSYLISIFDKIDKYERINYFKYLRDLEDLECDRKSNVSNSLNEVRQAALRLLMAMVDYYVSINLFTEAKDLLETALTQDIITKHRVEGRTGDTKSAQAVKRKISAIEKAKEKVKTMQEPVLLTEEQGSSVGARVVYDWETQSRHASYLRENQQSTDVLRANKQSTYEKLSGYLTSLTTWGSNKKALADDLFEDGTLSSLKKATDYFISIKNIEVSLLLATLLSALTENLIDQDHYKSYVKSIAYDKKIKLGYFLLNLLQEYKYYDMKSDYKHSPNVIPLIILLANCLKAINHHDPILCFEDPSDIGDTINITMQQLVRMRGFSADEAENIVSRMITRATKLNKQIEDNKNGNIRCSESHTSLFGKKIEASANEVELSLLSTLKVEDEPIIPSKPQPRIAQSLK